MERRHGLLLLSLCRLVADLLRRSVIPVLIELLHQERGLPPLVREHDLIAIGELLHV